MLENVKVRTEAFDYLQLPFAIDEGSIGRLQIQIPWGRWRSGPLKIELSGVTLRATARDETDWEEGPAGRRAQAAKQAELMSAEFEKLSRRVAQANQHSSKSRWSVAEYVSTYLLNSLQLSIKDVHVCFKVGGMTQRVANRQRALSSPGPAARRQERRQEMIAGADADAAGAACMQVPGGASTPDMAFGVQLQGLETCIDSRGKQPLLHAFDASSSLLQVSRRAAGHAGAAAGRTAAAGGA